MNKILIGEFETEYNNVPLSIVYCYDGEDFQILYARAEGNASVLKFLDADFMDSLYVLLEKNLGRLSLSFFESHTHFGLEDAE